MEILTGILAAAMAVVSGALVGVAVGASCLAALMWLIQRGQPSHARPNNGKAGR